jgi:folate-binding Fe-S cluster repair protein YgfZ
MLNLELTGAVAFDKGCYPGQEIVARSQYLGQVKRRLRRFRAQQAATPGTELIGSEGNAVGAVVLSAPNADGTFEFLAVVANEAVSTPLHLAGDPAPLEMLPLPYEIPAAAGAQADGR